MALVLILVIIASLSVLVAGSIKVITSINPAYSVNRNKTAESGSKITGKYICYKDAKDGKLNQIRLDYNPDGSSDIKKLSNLSKCEFEIPKGATGFDVYVVGAGDKGADSSYSIKYSPANKISCNLSLNKIVNDNQCESERLDVLKAINSFVEFTVTPYFYISSENENIECSPSKVKILLKILVQKYNTDIKLSTYLRSKLSSDNYSVVKTSTGYECVSDNEAKNYRYVIKSGKNYACSFSIDGNKKEELCNLDKPFSGALNSEINKITYVINKPSLDIEVGSAGDAGKVQYVKLKGNIFGDKNGSNKIEISKNSIADGSKVANGISSTKFTYYYQSDAKTYKSRVITAASGDSQIGNSAAPLKVTNESQLNSDLGQDGVIPSEYSVPSVFQLENLYPGYNDIQGNSLDATYFGASGASGFLPKDIVGNLAECRYVKFKGGLIGKNCSDNQAVSSSGSHGAPGAILITW